MQVEIDGKALKTARGFRPMSAVARDAGIAFVTYRKMENGGTVHHTIRNNVARVLGVTQSMLTKQS